MARQTQASILRLIANGRTLTLSLVGRRCRAASGSLARKPRLTSRSALTDQCFALSSQGQCQDAPQDCGTPNSACFGMVRCYSARCNFSRRLRRFFPFNQKDNLTRENFQRHRK
jgi:hypothetical protein